MFFALYLKDYLMFSIMSPYDPKFDFKINIGHGYLNFMVQ